MARTKEFDRTQVLDRATDLFWEKGYESTSVQDLVEAMGIGRASLYDTFGSKQELFAEVLERYAERLEAEFLPPLEQGRSPRKALADFFEHVAEAGSSEDFRGCLMVKSAMTTSRTDSGVGEQISRFTGRLDESFHRHLKRMRQAGELDDRGDLRALARFLTHTLMGLIVTCNVRKNPREVKGIVRNALSILD